MSWRIDGKTVTPQQVELLRRLSERPAAIETINGKLLATAERHGYVECEVEQAVITPEGKAVLARCGAGPGRYARKPKTASNEGRRAQRKGRAAKSGTSVSSSGTNGNGAFALNYDRLRSEIEARYQADLAALERVQEIVQVVLGDGGPRADAP